MTHRDDVPEWAKPGLDDPDAYDPPEFAPSGPAKEAPRHAVGCRCLNCCLIRLRMVLRSEAPGQLNTHAAPVLRDFEGIPERETDEGGIGLPLTAAMHRYLSGPDAWGVTRLGMLSIIEVSEACASRHPNHRRPLFTRSLCGDLLFKAAYLGQTVDDIVWITGLSIEQVTGMLTWGLGHAEEFRADKFARWTKLPGAEEPMPERRPIRPAA